MWNKIKEIEELESIKQLSFQQKVFIFKDSTTCPISQMVIRKFEKKWEKSNSDLLKPYYLDILKLRTISSKIANDFEVIHESPQILIIENGKCTYHRSHSEIDYDEILAFVS